MSWNEEAPAAVVWLYSLCFPAGLKQRSLKIITHLYTSLAFREAGIILGSTSTHTHLKSIRGLKTLTVTHKSRNRKNSRNFRLRFYFCWMTSICHSSFFQSPPSFSELTSPLSSISVRWKCRNKTSTVSNFWGFSHYDINSLHVALFFTSPSRSCSLIHVFLPMSLSPVFHLQLACMAQHHLISQIIWLIRLINWTN